MELLEVLVILGASILGKFEPVNKQTKIFFVFYEFISLQIAKYL